MYLRLFQKTSLEIYYIIFECCTLIILQHFLLFNRFCTSHKNIRKFICLASPVNAQRTQKGNWVTKKCVLVERNKISKMIDTEGKKPTEYLNGGQNNGTF